MSIGKKAEGSVTPLKEGFVGKSAGTPQNLKM